MSRQDREKKNKSANELWAGRVGPFRCEVIVCHESVITRDSRNHGSLDSGLGPREPLEFTDDISSALAADNFMLLIT